MNESPLSYLDAAGRRAAVTLPLTWTVLIISILVCLIIGILLWLGVRRARAAGGADATRAVAVERGGNGLRWIGAGLLISAVPLLITLVWTMVALASISGPPAGTALELDVTPRQWWWEATYRYSQPDQQFTTANEIHVPVGTPVVVRLHGIDVIHSFWVPKLSGKTDAIPGQTNVTWLEADAPGRYEGQCTEFCGLQHAHMAFEVVAEPPADFEAWREAQMQPAPPAQSRSQKHGEALVEYRCGLCHRIRGTTAGAISAPDLTHLMSRGKIASGELPNNPGNLAAWILDPQRVKPGTLMPKMDLTPTELADVVAYLETLK